jgi:hypothetical protein
MSLRSVAVLAVIGLWFVACGAPKQEAIGPTLHQDPLTAYAVVALSSEPLAPLSLKAVDPLTGADVPGRPPVELGHDGTEALSPDGATIALGWAPKDSGGYGPQRLSLLDTARWEKRDTAFQDGIARLFWSPDGSRIYAETFHCFVCSKLQPRLITLDAVTGNVEAEAELPFETYQSFIAPDGKTLYLFGQAGFDPQVVTQPPSPRLVAFDIQASKVQADLELPGLLYGQPQSTDTGLRVVDAGSFNVMRQLDPAELFHGVRFASEVFLSEASDQYVFALRGLQLVVLDSHDLHELSSGTVGSVYHLLVGPKAPADH